MTKAAKEVAYFLNTRPLCFLSMVFALRDFAIALGLFFAVPDIARTLLFRNLDELGGAAVYGAILAVIAVIQLISAVTDRVRFTRLALDASAFFWLFGVFSYGMNGNWLPAVIYIFMCSLPSGYISFYYKWTSIWDKPKRKYRLRHGLEIR